ncbi:MAG: C-GCAxxG-C-C family protein [Clostridiales bacterium]|nr:C-GCAxxG-C-C family protein [Candidatus Crickella merdequi]
MVKEVNITEMKAYLKEDFTTGFMCSESVLDTLNKFYDLGIGEEAIALSTGFPYGFGNGGNLCGGVAGATMALGKVFGRTVKGDPAYQKCIDIVRELNDDVAAAYKTSICPDLIADYDFKDPERKTHCTNILYVIVESFAKIMERECGVAIVE